MSRRGSDSEKVPAALYDRLTDTPTYAARMYKVQVTSSSQNSLLANRHLLSTARQHRRSALAPTVAAPLGQALGPLRLRPVGAFHVGVATKPHIL